MGEMVGETVGQRAAGGWLSGAGDGDGVSPCGRGALVLPSAQRPQSPRFPGRRWRTRGGPMHSRTHLDLTELHALLPRVELLLHLLDGDLRARGHAREAVASEATGRGRVWGGGCQGSGNPTAGGVGGGSVVRWFGGSVVRWFGDPAVRRTVGPGRLGARAGAARAPPLGSRGQSRGRTPVGGVDRLTLGWMRA